MEADGCADFRFGLFDRGRLISPSGGRVSDAELVRLERLDAVGIDDDVEGGAGNAHQHRSHYGGLDARGRIDQRQVDDQTAVHERDPIAPGMITQASRERRGGDLRVRRGETDEGRVVLRRGPARRGA